MCVPVPGGEAFGTYMLESMAAGVPVLQPREGAFPEAIELTGGGELYAPDRPGALAAALRSLLSDPQRVRELGRRGREKVSAEFGIDRMARETVALYRDALAAAGTRPGDET